MLSQIDSILIISTESDSLERSDIIGTGGWLPPEQRETLDWMTLGRVLGWRVIVIAPEKFTKVNFEEQNIKWIILTGNPDNLDEVELNQILHLVNSKPILLITSVGNMGGHFEKHAGICLGNETGSGNIIYWNGTGKKITWDCRNIIQLPTLKWESGYKSIVSLGSKEIVAAKRIGLGKIVVLSFQPSFARDLEGYFTALIKHLLIMECLAPVAWFNFENTLILRMDDPGSLEPVYNELYQNTKLNEQDWETIGVVLKKKHARISLGYVPGFVDDGNIERGILEIDGQLCSRRMGTVYQSRLVKYETIKENSNHRIYDYQAEYRGIQKLRMEELAEVELHGYTHLHPDRITWANATDRYLNTSWYREFGAEQVEFIKKNPSMIHPFDEGILAFSNSWNIFPTTLICPGDKFTNDVLEKALHAGLMMVSSYYLCLRIENKFCWAQHICSPYFNEPDSKWFDSCLPVIGYFHDFDITINGTIWFSNYLDQWEKAGAKYFMDFKEVAGILNHSISIKEIDDMYELSVNAIDDSKLIRPVRMGIFFPDHTASLELIFKIEQADKPIKISKKIASGSLDFLII